MRRSLAVLLLTLLTGCGGGEADTPAEPTPEVTPEATPEPTPEPTPEAMAADDDDSAKGEAVADAGAADEGAGEAADEAAAEADAPEADGAEAGATDDPPGEPADTEPPAEPTKPEGTDPAFTLSLIGSGRTDDTTGTVELLVRADPSMVKQVKWSVDVKGGKATGPTSSPGEGEVTLTWTLSGLPAGSTTGTITGTYEGDTQKETFTVAPVEAEPAPDAEQ